MQSIYRQSLCISNYFYSRIKTVPTFGKKSFIMKENEPLLPISEPVLTFHFSLFEFESDKLMTLFREILVHCAIQRLSII